MLKQKALSSTILAAAAISVAGTGIAAAQIDQITVTATKREQSSQDVPIALTAVSGETLEELEVGNFDDYVRYLPNVSFGGRGPGQSTPYIRGLAVQPITVLLSGAQGTTPNVALFLDEQPVTAPGRNLDVYATDIARIEVLPGPQGTLFGASSQAGTIRLITNKPDFSGFSAGVETSVGFTAHSDDMSSGVEGYINVPVNDQLAFRAAFYNVSEAGYIDNVPGTFTTDPAINPLSTATATAASYIAADNSALAEDDFNDSSYQGFRLSGTYLINDEWSLNFQHTQQTLEADGVFDYDPAIGDLEVTRFFPDTLEDTFGQTAWTLEGRLAMLDVVYTGGYLNREVDQSVDYTGYNNSGAFINYYTCTYTNPAYIVNYGIDPFFITPGGRECLDPTKGAVIQQEHERNTHELRFSTPSDNSWRLTAGVFFDNYEIETQDDYWYLAAPDLGFAPNAPISTAVQVNPATRPAGVTFFNDVTRSTEEVAFFGQAEFDLSDEFTLIAGVRQYNLELDFAGSSNFADGIFQGSTNTDRGRDYDVNGGHTGSPMELDGVITKFTLQYRPNDDLMFYATRSEGYRPGGWNRGGGIPSVNPAFPTVSATYDTDDVVFLEAGWKATLADGNLQFNGAIYSVDWTDMQVSRFDPQNVSILTFVENSSDAEIFGVEGDVIWTPNANLTLFGAFSFNDTELTAVNAQIVELVPVGSALPQAPEMQLTGRGRYEWMAGDFDAYAQVGIQYVDDSINSLVAADSEVQDGYTTADLSFGLGRGEWRASVFVENVTDERAELFINNQDDIRRITTNRPRTVTFRIAADF
ncbi:MAG: TonB-dependent receptor [Maricaulis sp.]|nr:TonB-dependent receptor [Maricaulis sp.]